MAKGKTTFVKCKFCNNEFKALLIKIRQGKGKYCSQQCYHEARTSPLSNKEKNKIYQAKLRYGLIKHDYLKLMETTNCSICNTLLSKSEKYIDHCHLTQKVRGVLCNKCNTGLGMFKDSILLLQNAIQYLNDHS